MTQKEFFGDWYPYLDTQSLNVALSYLSREKEFYPDAANVFKAFKLCNAKDCCAIFLGQDPYPQKNVATGILFGNKATVREENLSPSLQVVKEAAIDYTKFHHVLKFDNTLESWAKQGILMLNSSLTVKPYVPGSHFLYWKPFIAKFLTEFSQTHGAVAYVLFGKQAQSFEKYISPVTGRVWKVEHPAALARRREKLPSSLFQEVQDYVYGVSGTKLEWFHEEDYGEYTI